jgi:hypothetical protein
MPEQMKMKTGRGVAPIVDSPKLARMTEKAVRPRPIGGKIALMAAKPKPDAGKQRRMPAVPAKPTDKQPRVRPEQVEPRTKPPTGEQQPGYVRLRLRVDESGAISVVGAKAVEGPLVESKLQGALAYEITLGQKRIAAGAIPDAGERRSFPDPKGRGVMAGHHVTPLPTYDVNVRVSKAQVTAASLPRLQIRLYRLKAELPLERPDAGAIGPQFERELREVGTVKGIRPEKLPDRVADEVRAAFE